MGEVIGEWVFKNINGVLTAVPVELPYGFSVETRDPTNITDSSVTLNAELTELKDVGQVDVYFSWVRAGEETPIFTTPKQTLSAPGTFSGDVTDYPDWMSADNAGLDPDTIYEFWVVAETTDNAVSSKVSIFKTSP